MPKAPMPNKKSPLKASHITKIGLVAGILMLIFLPATILKIEEWKIRQGLSRDADALLKSGTGTDFGGSFSLIDHNGNKVTDLSYRGKYLLVYFGYTYCPDICPTALQNITEILDELGEDAKKVQVLFITVDPDRDTPSKMKAYVESFHPNITGLTGTRKQIAAVAKAYKVSYSKAEVVDKDDYLMETSSLVYILDPEGKPITSLNLENADPAVVAVMMRNFWKKKTITPKKLGAGSDKGQSLRDLAQRMSVANIRLGGA